MYKPDMDYRKAYTTAFVGKKYAMEMKTP